MRLVFIKSQIFLVLIRDTYEGYNLKYKHLKVQYNAEIISYIKTNIRSHGALGPQLCVKTELPEKRGKITSSTSQVPDPEPVNPLYSCKLLWEMKAKTN